jgi:YceI-like domain
VIGEDPAESSLVLSADVGSMEVIEGTGGIMDLTDEDRVEIKKTLEEEVLEPGPVEFRSTRVTPTKDGRHLEVSGELEMNGKTHPLDFELDLGTGGALSGTATLKQSDWGIEPYSGLFGTLKVRDEIEVISEASRSE